MTTIIIIIKNYYCHYQYYRHQQHQHQICYYMIQLNKYTWYKIRLQIYVKDLKKKIDFKISE